MRPLWLGLFAAALGFTDCWQSIALQRSGRFIENGLPALPRRRLVWGAHPTATQFLLGTSGLVAALLAFGELVLARWPWSPWALYAAWWLIEAVMVWRNWRFLRGLP